MTNEKTKDNLTLNFVLFYLILNHYNSYLDIQLRVLLYITSNIPIELICIKSKS